MVATLRALTPIFGRNNRPTRQAVRAIVDKFEIKFTLLDVPVLKRRRIARSEEIIAAVSGFFVDENDHHVTIDGERYRAMLEDYLWPGLDELDINDLWFQQDGATSHTARVTID